MQSISVTSGTDLRKEKDMNMDKERAIAVQKDLIHQLEDIRAIADRAPCHERREE